MKIRAGQKEREVERRNVLLYNIYRLVVLTSLLVSEGKTLNESFKLSGTFPTMMLQMINVGEATGTLDEMLSKLAAFYDEEVDNAVSSLLSVLEPIMMIFVGGIVGGLVISMYLPIFSLMQQF